MLKNSSILTFMYHSDILLSPSTNLFVSHFGQKRLPNAPKCPSVGIYCPCVCVSAHVLQEAAAHLAQVRLVLVELLLQALQEAPLEAVDVLDVAEDGAQLLLREHVRPLAALLDVTLVAPRTPDNRLALKTQAVSSQVDPPVM